MAHEANTMHNTAPIRILITALGGDLGQATVKALRLTDCHFYVIGSDSSSNGTASLFCDCFEQLPPASDANYIANLVKLARKHQCQIIIPSSEAEIIAISNFLESSSNTADLPCPIICHPWSKINKYYDKLTCYEYLQKKIPIVPFADASDEKAVKNFFAASSFPCIVKGRCSSGSRDVHIVNNKQELSKAIESTPMPLIQQFMDAKYGEFSVGVFVQNNIKKHISFNRVIGTTGASWTAHTEFNNLQLTEYVNNIIENIDLQGSYNIQLRHGTHGIGLLEINARFSSLVAARAASGFNDVYWSILNALKMPIEFPNEYKNIAFRRFISEGIDFGDGLVCLPEWQPRQLPTQLNYLKKSS